MKISIALAVLILVLAAAFGWHDHERLASVRANHAALVAEAAAKDAAAKFIAFAKEMEALEKKGGRPDEATQKRIMEFIELMMSLDASQLKTVIAEVRAAGDLKDEMRENLIVFSIMTMANDYPQATLALFTESFDLLKDNRMGNHFVSNALGRWAKDDPLGALDWVRKNGEKFPDLVTEDAKRGLISGAAGQNPKLALQLVGELKLKDANRAIHEITNAAKTAEQRSTTLAALREHVATLTDLAARDGLIKSAFSSLADSAAEDGFRSGSQWISNAGLSPKELEVISGSLAHVVKPADTGQWVEWLGETLPAGKADNSIRTMISNWTQKDYRAAGTWLASAPDGPAKQAAVRGYAETVAPYDPQAAAQWALTLPADGKRTQTLQRIHQQWPKDDAAGAVAFAQEHGLKP